MRSKEEVATTHHRFTAIIQVNLHQPALPVENWRMLLVQSFTVHMPLLTATSALGLGRRRSAVLFTQSPWAGWEHTHTHLTALYGRYQKGKTSLDFTEARDSEWQCHQLGHMQVCTSLQTDNHTSTPPLSFLQAVCSSCHPTNSVKALGEKAVADK